MKYFEETNIFIGTPKLTNPIHLESTLELLRACAVQKGLFLSVDEDVFSFITNEHFKDSHLVCYNRLLRVVHEISYKELVRRKHARYHLLEAILKMVSVFKLGVLDRADNTMIIAHLRHTKELYPTVLRLVHYANGKLNLKIGYMYNTSMFFPKTFVVS